MEPASLVSSRVDRDREKSESSGSKGQLVQSDTAVSSLYLKNSRNLESGDDSNFTIDSYTLL